MKKIFIRFGEIPTNEKSKIHRGDEGIIGEEIGVSVYEGIKEKNGEVKLIIPSLTYSACVALSGCLRREMYIVTGEEVGRGKDGEPLLKNVQKVK